MRRVLFSSASIHWRTPPEVYAALDAEFNFNLDPCPNGATDGLTRSWVGKRVYCNPPYGRGVSAWLAKANEADIAVYLLPSRTGNRWFHDYAMHATEIRFLRGRLTFQGAVAPEPFDYLICIFLNIADRS